MDRIGLKDLTYLPETDTWKDESGKIYLRNRFRADEDIFFLLESHKWSAFYSGQNRLITWDRPDLCPTLTAVLKDEFQEQLKRKALHTMGHIQVLLGHLEKAKDAGIKIEALLKNTQPNIDLWHKLPSSMRPLWRTTLQNRIDAGDPRVRAKSLYGISKARSRHNTQTLRSVLEWNPEEGALTTAELEVLRQALPQDIENLSNKDALTVLLLRTFLATLRRTQQITQIKNDGHKIIEFKDRQTPQHFLDVPKVKGQSHAPSEWEAIPETLGALIHSYSQRENVTDLQAQSGYLFVLPPLKGRKATPGNHYGLSSTRSKNLIHTWIKNIGIISPRTGKPMKITMNRLRHTGATQMARQGQSKQTIQDMLQHDSPASSSAYIDAVSSDLAPMFERANRHLGGVFDELNNVFFKGKVVSTPPKNKAPVIVPDPANLSVVGECSKQGVCSLNPLFSCYSGCPHFLAFKEANHQDVYDHVEKTYTQWQSAEVGAERTKSIKDFERVLKGVKEVIGLIEENKS